MKFLRDLRNKLSDKEREIAIAEYETEAKTKMQNADKYSRQKNKDMQNLG